MDNDTYRERARELIGSVPGATVDVHAHVQPVVGEGAFVEAHIWLPDTPSPLDVVIASTLIESQQQSITHGLRTTFTDDLRHRLMRECWKQHPAEFNVCGAPSCVLTRAVMGALGITQEEVVKQDGAREER